VVTDVEEDVGAVGAELQRVRHRIGGAGEGDLRVESPLPRGVPDSRRGQGAGVGVATTQEVLQGEVEDRVIPCIFSPVEKLDPYHEYTVLYNCKHTAGLQSVELTYVDLTVAA
jgi:hypothetical protein